jgi:hypothetical protein
MSLSQLALTSSVVAALAYLAIVSTIAVVTALRAGGRREDSPEGDDAPAASRLTMPVSIIVPAGTAVGIDKTIHQLLALTYPELEVIVMVDAPASGIGALAAEWQLESREFFYRRALETAPVRRIFRSVRDARLMVVEKDADHRSDLLNCGVNLARYRYVAVVPPGVRFDRPALLRAMAPALRDPGAIVGIGSHIERAPQGVHLEDRDARFQRLRSIRALMFTRLFWSRMRQAVGPDDAVVIWRRDAVVQANGFSRSVSDPDLDMMFRLQQAGAGGERRFVRSDDAFGQSDAQPAARSRALARSHQHAVLRAMAAWGPGASQAPGLQPVVHFLESELITPLAQTWAVLATTIGAAAGWLTWTVVVATLLLLSFGSAVVTSTALLLRGAYPEAPDRAELTALLRLAPLEVVLSRPLRALSRLAGLLGPSA